jgi:hypothetical protein
VSNPNFRKSIFRERIFIVAMNLHAIPVATYTFLMPFIMPIMILIKFPMSSTIPTLCWPPQTDPLACRKPSRAYMESVEGHRLTDCQELHQISLIRLDRDLNQISSKSVFNLID